LFQIGVSRIMSETVSKKDAEYEPLHIRCENFKGRKRALLALLIAFQKMTTDAKGSEFEMSCYIKEVEV